MQVTSSLPPSATRVRVWYGLLSVVLGLFVVRLFYLQVLRHDYYRHVALKSQLKEYEIPADRGIIEAHNGGEALVPIVLNETKYTLFADPKYIDNPGETAAKVQKIIGGSQDEYVKLLKADSRYAVLAKKLSKDQKDAVNRLKIKGLGTRDESYRTYPQGDLASQVLGFVSDDKQGRYGVEQALNTQLTGKPGELRAITDAQGVPLVTNKDNVQTPPTNGQRVVLTLDVALQKQVEDILKSGLDAAKSKSGSVIIMDPKTGAIKAMANYPSYNPNEFFKVEDSTLFNNPSVSSPLEVGSVMKPLTTAAALDIGAVTKDVTYLDPGKFVVDGFVIKNVEEDGGAGNRTLGDILQLSLNTGATWLLMQMGGGEINQKARTVWYDYMSNHYGFGKPTGIEQGYEEGGTIPDPSKGFGLNLQYANSAFGQGMSMTPLQLGAAVSSVINGGTYYQPRLVDATIDGSGKKTTKQPVVVRRQVVKSSVSSDVKNLMEYVVQKNHVLYGLPNLPTNYTIGGKTGTAEISKPGGGYYDDRFNGMFVGFVGGNQPDYVIVVRVNEPTVAGYAGAHAAAPIFSQLTTMMINNFGISPKDQQGVGH